MGWAGRPLMTRSSLSMVAALSLPADATGFRFRPTPRSSTHQEERSFPALLTATGTSRTFTANFIFISALRVASPLRFFRTGHGPWRNGKITPRKDRGPRIWTSGRAIGGGRTETEGGGSRAIRGNITVTTPDEARDAVRRKKDHGLDVIKLNEFISYDLAKAVIDEAHRWDMPVTAHSWDVIESVKAGVDGIEHIWSVGFSSILDVKRRRDLAKQRLSGNIEHELSGAFYEPENYGDIIEAMVKRGVAWTPTIAKWLCPLSPNASRLRERENQILNDPGANLPAAAHMRVQQLYDKIHNRYSPSQLDRVKMFYDKANEFIRRFVEAGGLTEGRLGSVAEWIGGHHDA